MKRKLIEVSLPLEAINQASVHEKSVPRKGHPATLHLWWARRPLAAARAVLFAQLVDDPSARPDEFPSEEDQQRERARLHRMVAELAKWENLRNEDLLRAAHEEIARSSQGDLPKMLDPFAGGGTIPLEAQRLGLDAVASDLNPVAVLVNRALIELAPRFRGRKPVFPGLEASEIRDWTGTAGLAADVRAYGDWMRSAALERIGGLYPRVSAGDGSSTTVIGWIWARTIVCSNPACGAEVPLVSSLDLSTKKGRECWLRPVVSDGHVDFDIETGKRTQPSNKTGQGAKFDCWVCGSAQNAADVHAQIDVPHKRPPRLLATVAEGNRRRIYLKPTAAELEAALAASARAEQLRSSESTLAATSRGTFGGNAQGRRYGFYTFADYFTDRQLIALTTFSDLVDEARWRVIEDGGSPEYADAVATYLAFLGSKLADWLSSLCSWIPQIEGVRDTFARQAIPMVWDFVEINPFSNSVGNVAGHFEWIVSALEMLPLSEASGFAQQADAASRPMSGYVISTDPPYYDNITYSDLADYLYVWLRRSLRSVHPDLFQTMLVPKAEELVANPYRQGGKAEAKKFFENGFREVFARAREGATDAYPMTVYYAFQQTELDGDSSASTGWETLLEGMIRGGWEITSTWPLRSERSGRMTSVGSNALASSIVLSLRPRPAGAPMTDRRGYIDLLREELPQKLREMQEGAIAPVDLAQSAIGPGMAVFSRFSRVVEPNGANVRVREALRLINSVLGEVLSDQEGDFDPDTRWCLKWFETHGFDRAEYGEAEMLAGAYNTSVKGLNRSGAVFAKGGEVRLLTTGDLPESYRPERDEHITLWEVAMHLAKALDESGLAEAGRILDGASTRVDVEAVKELAYLVFSLAEKQSMVQVAGMFNALVTSWPEVTAAAKAHASAAPKATEQAVLALDDELGD